MSFFDLEHIFVLFPPGAGGNFIAGLISKIDSKDLSILEIANSGSSHTVGYNKRDGGDSISFGSHIDERADLKSPEEKEIFYLEKIKTEYHNVNTRIVTWSHDHNNLYFYKKHFKNCKTLTITCFSKEEKLISIIMHINKIFLSAENPDVTLPLPFWNKIKEGLKFSMKVRLEKIVGKPIDFNHILKLRLGPYKDLILYLITIEILNYSKMFDILELIGENPQQKKMNNNIKETILTYSDVLLPYNYLKNKDFNLLKNSISKLFNKDLNEDELEFLNTSFNNYVNKQDFELIISPLEYFNNRKQNALTIINNIRNHNEYYYSN